MKKTVLAVVVLAVIGVAAAFGWRWHLISELREPVLSSLSDPDSAKFRNETLISPWRANNSVLCGEINAKNRMGGYSGYRSFATGIDGDQNRGAEVIDHDDIAKAVCAAVIERGSKWWWIRW